MDNRNKTMQHKCVVVRPNLDREYLDHSTSNNDIDVF